MRADVAIRSSRLTIGLLAALVAVVAFGGVGAIAIARHQRQTDGLAAPSSSVSRSSSEHATSASHAPADVAGTSTNRSAHPGIAPVPTVQSASASSTPATVVSVPESDPTTAPTGPSNNMTVQMSSAARGHARSQEVQQALQSYFDAINQHDYVSWTQSVTKALASHQSREQWLLAYATTVDSSIWMQSVRDDPLAVQIRFTSQQDPDLAPKDLQVDCIHWRITYRMADRDGQLSIGSTVEGSVDYAKC